MFSDVGAGEGIKVSVVGNGTVALPEKMGSAVVDLAMDWNSEEIRFEAQGEAIVFGKPAVVVFGANKRLLGSVEERKPRAYMIVSLQSALKMSELPGMGSVPGVEEAPTLAKGAKIAFSTFNGKPGRASLPFLPRDLAKAASGLRACRRNLIAKASDDVAARKWDLQTQTDAALGSVETVLASLAHREDDAPAAQAEQHQACDGACEALLQGVSALKNVSVVGLSLATVHMQVGQAAMQRALGQDAHNDTQVLLAEALGKAATVRAHLKRQRVLHAIDVQAILDDNAAVRDADAAVRRLFQSASVGDDEQAMFKEAWSMVADGEKQWAHYTSQMEKLEAWGVTIEPGHTILPSRGQIASETGLGRLLGRMNVTLSGRLNFEKHAFMLDAALSSMSGVASKVLGRGLEVHSASVDLESLGFRYVACTKTRDIHVTISAGAKLSFEGLSGSSDMRVALHGEFRSRVAFWATGSSTGRFGKHPVVVSVGIQKHLMSGVAGVGMVGAMVTIPDGFELRDLPGVRGAAGFIDVLPQLAQTDIWVSNFDGPMRLGAHRGELATYYMRNKIYVESGCTIPGHGSFGKLTHGKDIAAALKGSLDFKTGAFKFEVEAVGQVGVKAGGIELHVQSLML